MIGFLIFLIALDVCLTLVGLHDGFTEQFAPMKWLIAHLGAPLALTTTHGASIALFVFFPPSGYWLYGITAGWAVLAGMNLYRLMQPPV